MHYTLIIVGKRHGDLGIETFDWDYSADANVDHVALHGVKPEDVEEVAFNDPHFFTARPDYDGDVMVGPNQAGRFLYAAMIETPQSGVWRVIMAHWMERRRAERYYNAQGVAQ